MVHKLKLIFYEKLSQEKGTALILALLLLVLGSLIIGPLLSFMSTGIKTTHGVYHQKAYELYAADAGVRHAMLMIRNQDEALPAVGSETDWVDIDLPVNHTAVRYKIEALDISLIHEDYDKAYRITSESTDTINPIRKMTITADIGFRDINCIMEYLTLIPITFPAAGYATLAPTHVDSISLTDGGSGYIATPAVVIGPPTGANPVQATAAVTMAGTSIDSITILNPGSGYTSAPDITISAPSPGGSQATATAKIISSVASVTLTRGGAGYSLPPEVSFLGGGGSGAAAIAAISDGTVTSVTVTNGGSGYNSAPEVLFSGGFTEDSMATWPVVDEVTDYYYYQVQNLTPIPGGTIDLSQPEFQGPLYITGDTTFTTNNTMVTLKDVPKDQRIIFVDGAVVFNNRCQLNLNGYTIFSTSPYVYAVDSQYAVMTLPQTVMSGPGAIIAVGEVRFQPMLVNEEYIFLMSLTSQVVLQPNGDFVGAIAAYTNVFIHSSGASATGTDWTLPPELNIPGGTGSTSGDIITWIIH